jgi:hypothetical protein
MILKNWKFWILILVIIIILIWLKYGGKKYEFIGLKPLYQRIVRNDKSLDQSKTITNVSNLSKLVKEYPENTNKRRSRGETICCNVMQNIYNKPFKTCRPNWLKNPETGHNLELDCYNEELKIAVEYNGSQHYKFPNSFHSSKEKFIQQVRRDKYKAKMCEKIGVYLISVPYTVPHENIEEYIKKRLPDKSNN